MAGTHVENAVGLPCAKKQKTPGMRRGLMLKQKVSLPAGLEAGSATRSDGLVANDITAGDQLDPQRTVAFEVRGGRGLAKCIQAALLRSAPDAAVVCMN